jgi:hypothetical protein
VDTAHTAQTACMWVVLRGSGSSPLLLNRLLAMCDNSTACGVSSGVPKAVPCCCSICVLALPIESACAAANAARAASSWHVGELQWCLLAVQCSALQYGWDTLSHAMCGSCTCGSLGIVCGCWGCCLLPAVAQGYINLMPDLRCEGDAIVQHSQGG